MPLLVGLEQRELAARPRPFSVLPLEYQRIFSASSIPVGKASPLRAPESTPGGPDGETPMSGDDSDGTKCATSAGTATTTA